MRRIRVDQVQGGTVALGAAEAHHLRDVLRLGVGSMVEAFDAAGRCAAGRIVRADAGGVVLLLEAPAEPVRAGMPFIVASAVPKGQRADWMIEKLSELGAEAFVPLATERSVVHPEGSGKRQRWERLAAEAARQSGRTGIMRIEELLRLDALLTRLTAGAGWFLSTAVGARAPSTHLLASAARPLHLLIGPEGGWSEREMSLMLNAGLTPVTLGPTILRVETAAVAAAAVVAALGAADSVEIASEPTS